MPAEYAIPDLVELTRRPIEPVATHGLNACEEFESAVERCDAEERG
jgi:hypothetical protein